MNFLYYTFLAHITMYFENHLLQSIRRSFYFGMMLLIDKSCERTSSIHTMIGKCWEEF